MYTESTSFIFNQIRKLFIAREVHSSSHFSSDIDTCKWSISRWRFDNSKSSLGWLLSAKVQVDPSKRSCRFALPLELGVSDWRGWVVLATWSTRNQIGSNTATTLIYDVLRVHLPVVVHELFPMKNEESYLLFSTPIQYLDYKAWNKKQ